MNAGESLIDKFAGRFAIYEDQSFVFDLTIDEISEILKSLRFAADMERLWRECPNNVTVYHGGLQDTPAWITAGLFREKDSLAYVESGFHADIYAAARKAVEKLEGKSP